MKNTYIFTVKVLMKMFLTWIVDSHTVVNDLELKGGISPLKRTLFLKKFERFF